MKILITGGSGCIGSSLASSLVKSGEEVLSFDIRKNPPINESNSGINFICCNILDYNKISQLVSQVDGVIHLAALSRVVWGQKYPNLCREININGIKNILESIKNSQKKPWMIFGSSREVYGEQKNLPVSESAELNAINVYGSTKVIGESLCRKFSQKYKFNLAILRYSNVYGSLNDQLDRVIPTFILNSINGNDIVIEGGEQIFDFTHITDTIDGTLMAIDLISKNNNYINTDYHILTGTGTTLQALVLIIERELNSNSRIVYNPPRNYDVMKFYGNPAKAKNELGFSSKISVTDGIRKTINLYKKNIDIILKQKSACINFVSEINVFDGENI